MTKQAFLTELQTRLSGLPPEELAERLGFYGEMIDDRVEEGLSEEEAVAQTGGVDAVVAQILSDYPFTKLVRESVKPKRRIKAWEIVLLVLCSPVWLSFLITAVAVALSLYLVLWSLVIALWAVGAAAVAAALCEIIWAAVFLSQGNMPAGVASLGLGIFGAGCAVLLFLGAKAATKGVIILTKKLFAGIKSKLIGKERSK